MCKYKLSSYLALKINKCILKAIDSPHTTRFVLLINYSFFNISDSNKKKFKLFSILEMAKSKYAHFFVMKMLRYGTKAQKQIIVKEMEGKMAKVHFCFLLLLFLNDLFIVIAFPNITIAIVFTHSCSFLYILLSL